MATNAMFCSSLRQRHEWAEVPESLLLVNMPKWSEHHLEDHDLAVPFAQRKSAEPIDYFRFLLISPSNLEEASTQARIEKIYYKYGGTNIGILFLLNETSQTENRSARLMSIQANLFPNLEMPVLPLFNIKSLQNTISAFQQQLKQPSQQIQQKNSAISLLPYCSINPPIVEHARNILSDMCSSIPEFETLTIKSSGMERLNGLFSDFPQLLEEIIEFWREEYIAD